MNALMTRMSQSAGLIAGLLILTMMLHITFAVFLRALGIHVYGTIVIVSYYYMVGAVFLGIFTSAWQSEHIRVDVFASMFPSRVRRVTEFVAELVCLGYFLFFSWGLLDMAIVKTREGEEVDAVFTYLLVWPARWIALAGIALTAVVGLWRLGHMFANKDQQPECSHREYHE